MASLKQRHAAPAQASRAAIVDQQCRLDARVLFWPELRGPFVPLPEINFVATTPRYVGSRRSSPGTTLSEQQTRGDGTENYSHKNLRFYLRKR
jgi:hypothetical protein